MPLRAQYHDPAIVFLVLSLDDQFVVSEGHVDLALGTALFANKDNLGLFELHVATKDWHRCPLGDSRRRCLRRPGGTGSDDLSSFGRQARQQIL